MNIQDLYFIRARGVPFENDTRQCGMRRNHTSSFYFWNDPASENLLFKPEKIQHGPITVSCPPPSERPTSERTSTVGGVFGFGAEVWHVPFYKPMGKYRALSGVTLRTWHTLSLL